MPSLSLLHGIALLTEVICVLIPVHSSPDLLWVTFGFTFHVVLLYCVMSTQIFRLEPKVQGVHRQKSEVPEIVNQELTAEEKAEKARDLDKYSTKKQIRRVGIPESHKFFEF